MQFIYDHIIASVVGVSVILILLGLTVARSEESIDRTRHHMTREMQRTLAEMFERDVLNIGANVPPGEPMIEELSPTRFAFYGAVNGTGVDQLIEYVTVPVLQPDSTTLYRVDRIVDGVYTGGSQAQLSWFEVRLLRDNDVPVTAPPYDQARKVRLRFESALPFGSTPGDGQYEAATLRELYWESVYRPTLLNR